MAEVYKRLKKGCKWCQWSLLWVKHILKWNKVKNTKHLSDLQFTPHTNMKCRRIPCILLLLLGVNVLNPVSHQRSKSILLPIYMMMICVLYFPCREKAFPLHFTRSRAEAEGEGTIPFQRSWPGATKEPLTIPSQKAFEVRKRSSERQYFLFRVSEDWHEIM